MSEKEYILFCDESDSHGKYYSNFYGGLVVGASQYQRITDRLNVLKTNLNLHKEVKWAKVTERYLSKYQVLMTGFFDEIISLNLKVRIMFRQNANQPLGLTPEDHDVGYFKLYYQFIKHAFGLPYIERREQSTRLRLYFDQFPDTKEKAEQFKGYLLGLNRNKDFQAANILLYKEDITEVRSHDHVLLQCLDVVLGAMSFRLNDKHKEKLPDKNKRGNRTKAKEVLYKSIRDEIYKTRPNFNIGASTGNDGDLQNRWHHPYRHWCFQSKSIKYDASMTKGGQRKSPTQPT